MAFEFINPFSRLWGDRGLRWLLMPQALQQDNVQRSVKPVSAQMPPPENNIHGGYKSERNVSRPSASPIQARVSWKPIAITEWPEVWKSQYYQTKRGVVLWTYSDVGSDLKAGRNPDPDENPEITMARSERSRILRKMITSFRHAAGVHTFWPCKLTGDADLDTEIFWSGARALGCRCVIVFGTDCAASLLSAELVTPFTSKIYRGQKVVILKDIHDFSEDIFDRTAEFLKRALAQIVR